MNNVVLIDKNISNIFSVNKIDRYSLQFYEDCYSFFKCMIRATTHPKVIFIDSKIKCFHPFEFIHFIYKNWPKVDVFLLNSDKKETMVPHGINVIGRDRFPNKAKEYITIK